MEKYYYTDNTMSHSRDFSKTLHREDGPAIEFKRRKTTYKYWYANGARHRTDGPAVEYMDKRYWYLDGLEYSEKDFNKLIREAKQLPLALRLIDPREWVRKLLEK